MRSIRLSTPSGRAEDFHAARYPANKFEFAQPSESVFPSQDGKFVMSRFSILTNVVTKTRNRFSARAAFSENDERSASPSGTRHLVLLNSSSFQDE